MQAGLQSDRKTGQEATTSKVNGKYLGIEKPLEPKLVLLSVICLWLGLRFV